MLRSLMLLTVLVVLVAHAARAEQIGPSFDCQSARSPLPQILCSDPELSRLDLRFAQAYWTLLQQVGESGARALKEEDARFIESAPKDCGIPEAFTPPVPTGLKKCVSELYEKQRSAWASRLTGAAAEEANRPVEQHIALQSDLQKLGFLPADSTIEGVYGAKTRAAIRGWQSSTGRAATGLLGNEDAKALERQIASRTSDIEKPAASDKRGSPEPIPEPTGRTIIGVQVGDVRGAGGVPISGARVAGVNPGGPAEQAGIGPNDIIVAFGGMPVSNAAEVGRLVASRKPGESVQVDLLRPAGPQWIRFTAWVKTTSAPALPKSENLAAAPPPSGQRASYNCPDREGHLQGIKDPEILEATKRFWDKDCEWNMMRGGPNAHYYFFDLRGAAELSFVGKELDQARTTMYAVQERRNKEIARENEQREANLRRQRLDKQRLEIENAKAEATKKGYKFVSPDEFRLDGKELAESGAKIALLGRYLKTQNSEFLIGAYINAEDVFGSAASLDSRITIFTEHASRDLRKEILDARTAESIGDILVGKPINLIILGTADLCIERNDYGVKIKEDIPCIQVEDGWKIRGFGDTD
jgi:peptidoglycan hydrolase-like protein with peptidoglycan-binding domain